MIRHFSLFAALVSSFLPGVCSWAAEGRDADVVVYGATPGGVCAAVAAAREGAQVVLMEPMTLVGGMMSSGLSFSDSNQTDRRTLKGLFEEVHARIATDYARRGVKLPYDVAVKDNAHWTYEPHVAERIFHEMLKEAEVKVLLGQQLTSVEKEGAKIVAVRTRKGEFRAKQFIDATYEGDLMAAAKVSYVVGREGKKVYDESLAGHQFSKPRVMDSPRDDDGKLLPSINAVGGGPDETDGKIMTYSWRITMTNDPAKMVPMTKPPGYDSKRFEVARRLLKGGAKPGMVGLDLYPIPGGKVDVNNGIGRQISMGMPGENWKWPEATPEERAMIWQRHKDYALEFIWFLQTDESLPEAVRKPLIGFGLAKDEFTQSGNWPPVLYIREARRMVGEYVMTQHDVRTNVGKEDSIGISSFPIDSHDCQRVAGAQGGWVNEGTIFPVHMKGTKYGQPHQVPYRSLTPKRVECTNLLVPVCLSASHVAFSSIRVEPTWMMLGQSAGVAAALAAKRDLTVQSLPVAELQAALRKQGQVLDLLPEHLEAAKLEADVRVLK
jgi:hypothetical protein